MYTKVYYYNTKKYIMSILYTCNTQKKSIINLSKYYTLWYHYMNKIVNSKKVKEEYFEEIIEIYWPTIFEEEEKQKPKKIRTKENNFIMLLYMSETIYLNLLKKLWWEKKLWFAYLWYLQVLINTVDYSNRIDFNVYRSYWISDAMIKSLRKKFKEVWLVKNIWRDFYINPSVARKWQEVPMYVLELFKN